MIDPQTHKHISARLHTGERKHIEAHTCTYLHSPNAHKHTHVLLQDLWLEEDLRWEARASISSPPLPDHLLSACVHNRHTRLQELAAALNRWAKARRGRQRGICRQTLHPSSSTVLPLHLPRETQRGGSSIIQRKWENRSHQARSRSSKDGHELSYMLFCKIFYTVWFSDNNGRPLDLWPLYCNTSTGEVWQLRSLCVLSTYQAVGADVTLF